jgi:hypothetical protein
MMGEVFQVGELSELTQTWNIWLSLSNAILL